LYTSTVSLLTSSYYSMWYFCLQLV